MKLLYKGFIVCIITFLLLYVLIVTIPFPMGNGINDYACVLSGKYELWKINSTDYRVVLPDNNNTASTVISNVVEVAYNNNYIFVKTGYFDENKEGQIVTSYTQKYHIIDSLNKVEIYSCSNEIDFINEISKLGITYSLNWAKVYNADELQTIGLKIK